MVTNYKYYLLFSTLGHLILVLLLALNLVNSSNLKKSGESALPAYAASFPPRFARQQENKKTDILSVKKSAVVKPAHTKKLLGEKSNLRHQTSSQAANNSDSHKANKDEQKILTLLHQAIAARQSYPDEALALQQMGKVTIRFLLYPDGHLENAAIIKSSGITSIDHAALIAINAISPIKEVSAYLAKAAFFSVDIVFQ